MSEYSDLVPEPDRMDEADAWDHAHPESNDSSKQHDCGCDEHTEFCLEGKILYDHWVNTGKEEDRKEYFDHLQGKE